MVARQAKVARKMLKMRPRRGVRVREGPLLLPARVILLASGLGALALGTFNLFHEIHAAQVDRSYTIVALAAGIVWLACVVLGFLGWPIGLLGAGTIAFIELGVVATTHFAQGAGAIGSYARSEGLPLATALMGLVLACVLTIMAVIVCWSHATGHSKRWATLPILIVSAVGALLAILEATDNVHLGSMGLPGFGSTSAEDGTFGAAVTASLWLVGGLWIARVRRTGALLVALATFGVCYSFVTLHLEKGGTSMSTIATKSGLIWAFIAAAAAVLAAASFLFAVGLLALSILRRKPAAMSAGTQPAQPGT